MKCRLVLLVLLLVSASADLYAQLPELSIGDRVRLRAATLSPKPTVGHVDALHADALVFVTVEQGVRSRHRLAFDEIDKLERSEGVRRNIARSASRGAVRGAMAGAVAGGTLVLLSAAAGLDSEYQSADLALILSFILAPRFVLYGLVLGTATGTVYGLLSKSEQWKRIPLGLTHSARANGLTLTIPLGR